MISKPVCLRVKGPFACFTRPEFHVERVSYPVITPSAARGILEAILMKPVEKTTSARRGDKVGFTWHVLRMGVVSKGTMFPILRNELGYDTHPSYGHSDGYDIMDSRTQRHSLILKDVEYLIEARIEVSESPLRQNRPVAQPSVVAGLLAKYHSMFLRRARAGQCYYQPFLGCREFSSSEWELIEPVDSVTPNKTINDDFGIMFRDFDFAPVWNHWGHKQNAPRPAAWDAKNRPVAIKPLHAVCNAGWIKVARVSGDGTRIEESNTCDR